MSEYRDREVAAHYNRSEHRDTGHVKDRYDSVIINLRNFNNTIKSALISQYCGKDAVVLDLCSGKSGDLAKFRAAGAKHVVSADIALKSLEDAVLRYNKALNSDQNGRQENSLPSYQFINADCFEKNLLEVLPKSIQFDLVSCQFALHYAFDTEVRVRQGLYNVATRLKKGGYFIGTIPDCNVLMHKFRESRNSSFGNELVNVRWIGKPEVNISECSKRIYQNYAVERADPYGYKYIFNLAEAIDDCPEFLVHFETFEKLASEYGLKCICKQNFHDFFMSKAKAVPNDSFKRLLKLNKIFVDEQFPSADWEVAHLYRVFVFQKDADIGYVPNDSTELANLFQKKEKNINEIVQI